jgi:hypothetical protein
MPHWYQILQSLRVYLFMILYCRAESTVSQLFLSGNGRDTHTYTAEPDNASIMTVFMEKKTSKGWVSKSYENISVCKKEPE